MLAASIRYEAGEPAIIADFMGAVTTQASKAGEKRRESLDVLFLRKKPCLETG